MPGPSVWYGETRNSSELESGLGAYVLGGSPGAAESADLPTGGHVDVPRAVVVGAELHLQPVAEGLVEPQRRAGDRGGHGAGRVGPAGSVADDRGVGVGTLR